MRYSGDDYCYGEILTRLGFWKAQWISYIQPQAFNGNRYSLTFFSSLSGLFGPYMNGILPGLAILLWLMGIVFAIRSIAHFAGIPLQRGEILLLSEILIFFTLYMAQSLPQILYWRSGMLPYLAPLITNTFLLGVIIKQVQRNRFNLLGLGIILFLAFLAGGFSEAATALQLGYLTLLMVGILLLHRDKIEWKVRALQSVGVALISSLVAMLLLAFSPSNAERFMNSSRPDLVTFISISLNSALSFIIESLKGLPLPTAILFFFSLGISWIVFSRSSWSGRLNLLQWAVGVILSLGICYCLVVFCTVPHAYIQSAYPEPRTLLTARFVMVLTIVVLGGFSGLMVSNLSNLNPNKLPFLRPGVLLLLGILCFYPVYGARNVYRNIPKYQRWASYWDARDREIRQAKQNNIMNVEVIKIDHIIPNVSDLTEDVNFWYNVCAAGYYGVRSINADKPGWDNPQP